MKKMLKPLSFILKYKQHHTVAWKSPLAAVATTVVFGHKISSCPWRRSLQRGAKAQKLAMFPVEFDLFLN